MLTICRHDEVYGLGEKFRHQQKDRQEVIQSLTKENEEKMKAMIELENKIETLEKRNQKQTN